MLQYTDIGLFDFTHIDLLERNDVMMFHNRVLSTIYYNYGNIDDVDE